MPLIATTTAKRTKAAVREKRTATQKAKTVTTARQRPQRKPAQAKPDAVWDEKEDEDDHDDDGDEGEEAAAITAQQLAAHAPIVKQTQLRIRQQQEKEGRASTAAAAVAPSARTHRAQAVRTAPSSASSASAASAASTVSAAQLRNKRTRAAAHLSNGKRAAATTDDQSRDDDEEDGDEPTAEDEDDSEQPREAQRKPAKRVKLEAHKGRAAARSDAAAVAEQRNPADDVTAEELAERGVVYLGHLPLGFYEEQMRAFFSQFGEVTRLRLSRNPKTGHSRHYAFVEFAHQSVAQLVADAMHQYMMFGHTLQAVLLPPHRVHADMFGNGRRWRRLPHRQLQREQHNAQRSAAQQEKRLARLLAREKAKRRQLTALGVSSDFSGYAGELALAAF